MNEGFICLYVLGVLFLGAFLWGLCKELYLEYRKRKRLRGKVLTGYSNIEFELVPPRSECEESKALLDKLKVGDYLTCMIFPSDCNGIVSVNIRGFEVGVVDKHSEDSVYGCIFTGSYVSCRICRIYEDDKGIHRICSLVYQDAEGIYIDKEDEQESCNLTSSDTVSYSDDYLWISFTGQMVFRFKDLYYKEEYGSETVYVMDEDDTFFLQFVMDYLRGFILTTEDKTQFIRDCSKVRCFGNSKVLRKRINAYIKDMGIMLNRGF